MVVESVFGFVFIHEVCFKFSILGKYNIAFHNPDFLKMYESLKS